MRRPAIGASVGAVCLTAVLITTLVVLMAAAPAQAEGSWTSAGSMATARSGHTATLLPNGKVLVVGGVSSAYGAALSTAELYDPAANTWTSAARMAIGRDLHSATLLSNGRVLVAGGAVPRPSSGFPVAQETAEQYDPSTNTWTRAASMATARFAHTGTLLQNGKVLVAGGNGGLATAELYDPAANTWTSAASMAIGRSAHTASPLPNGKVLVAGGAASALAELYNLESAAEPTGSSVSGGGGNSPAKPKATPIPQLDCGQTGLVEEGAPVGYVSDPRGQQGRNHPAYGADLTTLVDRDAFRASLPVGSPTAAVNDAIARGCSAVWIRTHLDALTPQ